MFDNSPKASLYKLLGHALAFCPILRGKRRNTVLALVVLGGGILVVIGCDGQGAAGPIAPIIGSGDQTPLPLVPSESLLNLGEVPAGGRKQGDFRLINRTPSPVEVTEIETSCDCLTIDLPNRIVPPAHEVSGRALLELAKESRFTGNLGIQVRGRGKSGQVVFEVEVKIVVNNK